jgi:hypothetical protein
MDGFFAKLKEMLAESRGAWSSHLKDALARLTAATRASPVDECFRLGLFRGINELYLEQAAMLPPPAQVRSYIVWRAGVNLSALTANVRKN